MNDIPQVIDLVSIELTGSEFRTEQESALRQKLKTEPFAVMVRGATVDCCRGWLKPKPGCACI